MTAIAALEGVGDQKVLVLHCWVMDSSVWLPTRALSDVTAFTLAYVDFPGYGASRPSTRLPESIDAMAEVALSAADTLGWKTFAVVGHSMGATTALRVATLAPAAVDTVVAVSPVSPAGTAMNDETLAAFRESWKDPAAAVKSVLSPTMTDAALRRLTARSRSSMSQAVWNRYLVNWLEADFFSDLESYPGPVSLLSGDQDPFVTQEQLGHIRQGLPTSTVAAIAGVGHYPMLEAPQATSDAIEYALAGR